MRRREPRGLTPSPVLSPSLAPRFLLACALILAAALSYAPSLKVPFLLDDHSKIVRNPDIKSLSNLPSHLVYPYEEKGMFNRNDPSRPLTYFTLTLNYHVGQLNPAGYHVVNIGLHAVAAVLFFLLAGEVFLALGVGGITLPFAAALLFAVHPVNVNVVTYVIGRAASLATIFFVASVLLFLRARRGFRWGIPLSAACYVLALASNQLALTLPAVILFADLFLLGGGGMRRIRDNAKQHGLYWGLLAIYLGLRLVYFGSLGDLEATVAVCDRTRYALTQAVVLWRYVGMILVPVGLSFEHLYGPIERFTDPRFLGALALFGVTVALVGRGLKRGETMARLGAFGGLWFLATVAPTSSLFPTTATLAENRVYLPSLGLFLFFVYVAHSLVRRNAVFLLLLGSCAALLGLTTFRRNGLYQQPVKLWADVVRRYPTHERAHKNLGIEFYKLGNFAEMAAESEKALALDPSDFDARNNLAAAYYNLGDFQRSLAAYQAMVKERPGYAPAYSNMAMAYERLSDTASAILAYKEAIRLNPNLIEPLSNLAGLYLDQGRVREAGDLYEAALRIDPHNEIILRNHERVKQRR